MKKMLIIFDGASDIPIGLFGGKTPLEIANTPNLDFLANFGQQGYMYSIDKNTVPGSDNAMMSIFGNDPKECKRGVYEAIGSGFNLKDGDLAFRTNFATIDNLKNKKVIDRRAGRTLTTKEAELLAKSINQKVKLKKKFIFKPTVQHRGVLVVKGNLSEDIGEVDIPKTEKGKIENKFELSNPLNKGHVAKISSEVINEFVAQSYQVLSNHPVNITRIKKGLQPANMIFLRGAGHDNKKVKQYKNWMSINSMPLEIGIAKSSGMKNFGFTIPKMNSIDVYSNLHKSLDMSIKFAIKTLKNNYKRFHGCYIHFKETDIPGHDNKPYEKKSMLEKIDKDFFGFLKNFAVTNDIEIAVTCDHSTPCKLKNHSSDPVPVLLFNGKHKDETNAFSEKQSKKGSLGKIFGKFFMKTIKF